MSNKRDVSDVHDVPRDCRVVVRAGGGDVPGEALGDAVLGDWEGGLVGAWLALLPGTGVVEGLVDHDAVTVAPEHSSKKGNASGWGGGAS